MVPLVPLAEVLLDVLDLPDFVLEGCGVKIIGEADGIEDKLGCEDGFAEGTDDGAEDIDGADD